MKEKMPLNPVSPVPFPSNAIAAEAERRDSAGQGDGPMTDAAPTLDQPGNAPSASLDSDRAPKMTARDVRVFYGDKEALKGVDIDIFDDRVTAFIGPSGCGKSTFLRCLNRMNDTISSAKVTGRITLDGDDIYDKSIDVVDARFPSLDSAAPSPLAPRPRRRRSSATWRGRSTKTKGVNCQIVSFAHASRRPPPANPQPTANGRAMNSLLGASRAGTLTITPTSAPV